jgi:hypothetical protein
MSGIQRFFPSKRVSDPGSELKVRINASGGIVSFSGGYKIHTFNQIGNFLVDFSPNNVFSSVECLLITAHCLSISFSDIPASIAFFLAQYFCSK